MIHSIRIVTNHYNTALAVGQLNAVTVTLYDNEVLNSHYTSGIFITLSSCTALLLETRARVVLLWVSVVLAGCIGKAGVVLGLTGNSVVGDTTETVLGLAA
jgi:hypothetical protein